MRSHFTLLMSRLSDISKGASSKKYTNYLFEGSKFEKVYELPQSKINKGTEVTFIKYINSDMFDEKDYYNKWAEVKYGDSTGYVHMYTEYNVDNNGALESSEDIFENLARFGWFWRDYLWM